ncbi:erythronate-4-phosphate dehydrogenase [Cyclonatronum proteinivorum]|uniref:Erythronate-4-phosphate dehydrogenase n=1 Tax=Cyclonatronum proteinivorum TaxID=1457365 RepID=A0A345UKB1_9BACT|nr:4-phosphoerythronate dehydrogenase [Cyclonatronum proteinivorum]AXJ00913.1 erythronate-4-phosphate dehydrogenase [Cyclonatronum proteinivorum]
MITLLCENHIPWLKHLLPHPEVQVLSFWDDVSLHEQLPQADALLIRTVTRINPVTFPQFPARLKAVATATAGFDHVDQNWLALNGIRFFYAPGCNARSVGEYVGSCVVAHFGSEPQILTKLTASIIGCGQTGSHTTVILEQMGVRCMGYDPPKAAREPDFKTADFEALLEADLISLHVPLTPVLPHPTQNLLGADFWERRKKPLRLLINAARGGVLDETAARNALKSGLLQTLILDVWENEPQLSPESLHTATIATPHIAGYSQQAKYNASRIICEALSHYLDFPFNPQPPAFAVPEPVDASAGLQDVLHSLHPAFSLDPKLRANPAPASFATLRNEAAQRCEFRFIGLQKLPEPEHPTAKALGFILQP